MKAPGKKHIAGSLKRLLLTEILTDYPSNTVNGNVDGIHLECQKQITESQNTQDKNVTEGTS